MEMDRTAPLVPPGPLLRFSTLTLKNYGSRQQPIFKWFVGSTSGEPDPVQVSIPCSLIAHQNYSRSNNALGRPIITKPIPDDWDADDDDDDDDNQKIWEDA